MMPNLTAPRDLAGNVIGGCRLISHLGTGGTGQVYLAEQTRLGNRKVAVKIIRSADTVPFERDVSSVETRFIHEGRFLAQLSHPNILPVYDSGIEDGYLYLVMQYAPDGSLADAIKGRSAHSLPLPAPIPITLDVIGQVAAALQYTHEHGVVHRDVKPGNVLVQIEPAGRWHVMLADFGVARPIDATGQAHQAIGTAAYMAPEQFDGKFTPASDQYALGVMAFLLLTGRPPFMGDLPAIIHGHLFDAPPSLLTLNAAVTPSADAVIARALAKDPGDRFPSVAVFMRALEDTPQEASDTMPALGMATIQHVVAADNGPPNPTKLPAREPRTTPRPLVAADTVPMGTTPAGASQATARDTRTRRRELAMMAASAAIFIVAAVVLALANGGFLAGSSSPTHGAFVPAGHTSNAGGGLQPAATTQPARNGARLIASGAPATVQPGQQFSATVTYANVGTTTWSTSAGYALACDTAVHPGTSCFGTNSASLGGAAIPPGQQHTFTLSLTAPVAPGTYQLWWTMTQSGTAFADRDAAMQITVTASTPQPTSTPTVQPSPTQQPTPVPTVNPQPTATTAAPSPPAGAPQPTSGA